MLRHGRSRGVTQVAGNLGGLLDAGYAPSVDEPATVAVLRFFVGSFAL